MNPTRCIGGTGDASHVFVCPACRIDAKIAAAWKSLRVVEEPSSAPGERFVRRIVARVERDRSARRRRRWLAAAAAAALFAFCAGLAHEHASAQGTRSAEESYASLGSPNALEALLPN